ncbi:xanthine dehydrogenase family protein molybdopterin-binding subunit [Arthrobacter sp. 7Tela_A1]|uniref:xanthine dehydrogenase family protein molybdopterin-binding subunit n=1 Tax=Arthrobacter sp. 7Tela_A1 TaxID=3093745 RepID=UPI003BB5DA9B
MTELLPAREIGLGTERLDGILKVTGTAPYAYEQPAANPLYLFPVLSTIARGRITAVDTSAAEAVDGVTAVLTHLNAPRLASTEDKELAVLQGPEVGFRGQFVAAVLAETPESAREAAAAVVLEYEERPHRAVLDPDDPLLYRPEELNTGIEPDSSSGDIDAAFAGAEVVVEATYSTPAEHNNPMEPHATTAEWDGQTLTLCDSTQGSHVVKGTLAPVFGLAEEQVRVISPYVGGGFGSKGMPHANVVLAGLAALSAEGRPVRFALTRQQMFSLAGYRTPTIQKVRLAADGKGTLRGLSLDVVEQTSATKEFAEQTPAPIRMMYAAPARSTTTRLAKLDIPVNSWMRAPGECPGMFGPEVAMDELAEAVGADPLQLRLDNDTQTDPETGKPFASRHLAECLKLGARHFGWDARSPLPRRRLVDGWWQGLGVASATYPFMAQPGNKARIRYDAGTGPGAGVSAGRAAAAEGGLDSAGVYTVQIGAADIGTGAWTVLSQIAADALDVPLDRIRLEIGDSSLPLASVAGGSSGTASWGGTIIAAADAFRADHGDSPSPGAQSEASPPKNPAAEEFTLQSFGAHFAEVHVNADTGEVRVARMLGVFSAGRIINPSTARSQFLGGMTMGLGMALHEQSVMDPRFGIFVNHDLAEYHVPTNADVLDMEALWIEDDDPHAGKLGARGIGEIGIVGAAAAVVNAAYNATGIRVRELPLTPDKFLA